VSDQNTNPVFHVTLNLKRLVDLDQMDDDDQNDPFLVEGGTEEYYFRAPNSEMAEEEALDRFHDKVAISVLDDFEIETKARALSNHEIIALKAAHPGFMS
jgi:hypothetical protein